VTDNRSETQPLSPWEEKQVAAAAYAAGAIGGRAGDEDVDPAQRPLQEAGEGEAEGFELAEEDLIEAAEWLEVGRPPSGGVSSGIRGGIRTDVR
jgi:hypothetical protein